MRRIAPYTLIALALGPALLRAQTLPPIRPPALRPGDTVAVVAPAGKLERSRVELACSRLLRLKFRVRVPENLYRKRGYLAGSDEDRAAELMAAFRDPAVKAIFPGTGGFGTTRMLERLDYDAIRNNPKILVGFSDITGLHLAIGRKTGLITFHGPVLMYGLGSSENLSTFSAEYLWRALLHDSYFDWARNPLAEGYPYHVPAEAGTIRTLSPGRGQGRLTGGNLSLVCALMGTPFEIDTDGRVLFLEDVNEEPYRIDRYLSQLRLAGKLDRLAGVILGVYRGCESKKGDDGLSLDQVFNDYFAGLRVPVIVGFPAGHNRENATLPMNALVELDATARRVRVLENPVQIDEGAHPSANDRPTEPPAAPRPADPEPTRSAPHDDPFDPPGRPAPRPVNPEILRRIP